MNQFPQTPEYNISAVLIFFEDSWRYSQLKVTPVANVKNVKLFCLDTFG